MLRSVAASILLLAPSVAYAESDYPALKDVLIGAVSITSVAGAYVLVAKERESFLCAMNISPDYFANLAKGDELQAAVLKPGAICVPTSKIKNLGDI